jgi:hypothetical protein
MSDTTLTQIDSISWSQIAKEAYSFAKTTGATIIDSVKEVAPWAWKIVLKQVYVEAIVDILTPIIIFILTAILRAILLKTITPACTDEPSYSKVSKKEFKLGTDIGYGVVFLCGVCIVAIALWPDAIKTLLNPEYYAIHKLMTLAGIN